MGQYSASESECLCLKTSVSSEGQKLYPQMGGVVHRGQCRRSHQQSGKSPKLELLRGPGDETSLIYLCATMSWVPLQSMGASL